MSRVERYNVERKLNMKKVFAVIIAIIVIIMVIVGINKIIKKEKVVVNHFTDISYFPAYNNGKWGVINSNGDTVIEPSYDEMIVIPNAKKDVFICTYDVNYSDGTYKTKAINSKNEQIYSNYTTVEQLTSYDKNNNISYDENALKVQKDGKYGLINYDGSEILGCTYDKIDTLKNVKNSILLQKDGLFGLANGTGNIVIEPKYTEIQALTDEYTNGYIVKNADKLAGVVGINKEQILECKYTDIKHVYGNGLYVVKENNKWKIINKDLTVNTEISYDDVKEINDNYAIIKTGDKYGIIGTDKSEKIKPEYQDLTGIFTNYYIAKKDNKYGVINLQNEAILPFEYSKIEYNKNADCLIGTKDGDNKKYLIDRNIEVKATGTDFKIYDGYIRLKVDDNYKIYNLKFEEKNDKDAFPSHTLFVAKNDGKYGIINKEGTLIAKYEYEDATEQNEYGFVGVKKDGKWGIIDQYGNIVVEPKFELTDVSDIIFAGKWHSKEGVNVEYFVCE